MTHHVFTPRFSARFLAALLSAVLLVSLTACGGSETGSSAASSSSQTDALSSEESLPSATEDPSLKGEGSVGLLESVGSKENGFAFSGAAWFSDTQSYLKKLAEIWPDAAKGELETEYQDSASAVYVTSGMAQFSDFTVPACFRITETGGTVSACSYVFRFDSNDQEGFLTAFLQARDMLTETFGGADEDIPAFDSSFPNGGTWYGSDGSGLGISDTSVPGENYQFEISLSAPQAKG